MNPSIHKALFPNQQCLQNIYQKGDYYLLALYIFPKQVIDTELNHLVRHTCFMFLRFLARSGEIKTFSILTCLFQVWAVYQKPWPGMFFADWHWNKRIQIPYWASKYLALFLNCWNNTIFGRFKELGYKKCGYENVHVWRNPYGRGPFGIEINYFPNGDPDFLLNGR